MFSNEMLADNEVGLMGWRAREVGRMHRELKRREAMKCLGFYSTGPAVTTGLIGLLNRGAFYPQLGYTNFITATALTWEQRIAMAVNRLLTQTITVGNARVSFPVRPDTIVANPAHQQGIQKVLNASITVVGTGVGFQGAGGAAQQNVAGTNIFVGMLPNQIYDPTIETGQAFVLESKRGLVMVNREALSVEEQSEFAFDATVMRSKERFLPAVVEERFICDLQITG